MKIETSTSATDELLDRLASKDKLLENIGQFLVTSTRTRIRTTKTSPDGTAWAPWAPSTAAARLKTGGTLLYQTGALFNSIKATTDDEFVYVSSELPYAPSLQHGTPKMPARPYLGFSESDSQYIIRQTARHLFGKNK